MPEQSSAHFYLNWAKERVEEKDAALASLVKGPLDSRHDLAAVRQAAE